MFVQGLEKLHFYGIRLNYSSYIYEKEFLFWKPALALSQITSILLELTQPIAEIAWSI